MASAALLLRLSFASGFGGAKPLLRPVRAKPLLRPVRAKPRPFSASFARCATLEPPDVSRLAATARISITQEEVEECGPKIRQVIDWFGQLQAVNLETIEPSFRAVSEVSISQREDLPETFENREAMIAAVPSFEDAYIKVPKVLNKD